MRQHPADAYSTRSEGVPEAWNATVAHDMALAYHGQIAEVDNMVGRVQKALDASGAASTTYFVFTSDHVSRHDIARIWVAFFSRCQRYRC